MTAATALESLLRRERVLVLAGPLVVAAVCWAWLVPAALDMYGDMDGLAAWMMQSRWDLTYAALIFGMWAAMMTAMMLPSAAPALLIYGHVCRSDPAVASVALRVHAFAAGYLLVWAGFSAAATLLQWQLAVSGLLTPMMELGSARVGGALLILAGAWQWTPLKRSCLAQCRSPAAFISAHWRRGIAGALRMGVDHGLYCLGCCWAVMLLLFVGGVMSLAWIAAISVFVLVEKLGPATARGGQLAGAAMVLGGLAMLLR
ncbi:MAG TPA: DUF2182 domain-containing protein [Solimonas sp.]|nr:DUF2182 domain-containing protein [Solimonas sp.]